MGNATFLLMNGALNEGYGSSSACVKSARQAHMLQHIINYTAPENMEAFVLQSIRLPSYSNHVVLKVLLPPLISSHPVSPPIVRIFGLFFAVSLWHIIAIGARRQGE